MRVREHVHDHALQQHRVGLQGGESRIQGELDVGRPETEFVDRGEDGAGGIEARR